MKLPKMIYAVIKNEENESFLLSSADMRDLGFGIGDRVKIGVYRRVGFYNAEGRIEIGKLQKD